MRVWAIFDGGINYSTPSVHEARDVVEYSSLSAAIATVWDRYRGRDREWPNVDRSAEMHVWLADPRAEANEGRAAEYPDRRVFIGPRDGIRVERV